MKINWKLMLGALWFLIPASNVHMQEVEHAPTAEQCRADQVVWGHKLQVPAKDWATTEEGTSSRTLIAWVGEMGTCAEVDAERIDSYSHTAEMALLVVGSRKADFITRHNLGDQFFSEDDAGLR
jgi:hypothetical protein